MPDMTYTTRLEAAVGAVLDDLRTPVVQFWAPILLGLIMLFDSWDSIAIAYVMPTLAGEWQLTAVHTGFLISSGYFGQFIGAIALGAVAERRGRLPVFVGCVAVMSLLAFATAFAPGYEILLCLRFAEGLAIGGALPISATYINELAPTNTRGRFFTVYQIIAMAGYAVASLASAYIIPHWGWRWLFGIGAVPILLLPMVMMKLPESPRWLAKVGRLSDANRALAKLGGGPAVPGEGEPADDVPAPRPPLTALFQPPFLGRTMVVTSLWALTFFVTFGLTTWIPSIYVTVFKIPVRDALLFSSLGSWCFLFASPIAGAVMDRTGRKPICVLGALAAVVCMAALAIHPPTTEWILVTLVITGQNGVSIVSLVLWPYTAETYPTNMRTLGVGYGSAMGRAGSMLTPLVAGYILGTGQPITIVFAVYAFLAFVSLVIWAVWARETARVQLHTI